MISRIKSGKEQRKGLAVGQVLTDPLVRSTSSSSQGGVFRNPPYLDYRETVVNRLRIKLLFEISQRTAATPAPRRTYRHGHGHDRSRSLPADHDITGPHLFWKIRINLGQAVLAQFFEALFIGCRFILKSPHVLNGAYLPVHIYESPETPGPPSENSLRMPSSPFMTYDSFSAILFFNCG